MDGVGEQAPFAIEHGQAGFIAGGLDTKDFHTRPVIFMGLPKRLLARGFG
jgi:hypothetical protein